MAPALDFDRHPLIALWEVTRACAPKCVYCRTRGRHPPYPHELTTAEARELIEQLRELAPGVLVLAGGDPLERRDLFRLIERAVQRGLTVALEASVTPLLDAAAIERLASAGLHRIALAVDGSDALVHDEQRGVTGSFRATLAAVVAVRAAGLGLQITTRLGAATVHDLPTTGHLVETLAPELWNVVFVVPVGANAGVQPLGPDACEAVFHYLCDWSERTGLAVKTTAAPAYRRVLLERDDARRFAARRAGGGAEPPRRRPRPPPVNDGKGLVFVSSAGEVYPSGLLPLTAGNVRNGHLATIYRRSLLLRALRFDGLLGGKCAVCAYRHVCGGSRARAWAATGDVLAADPACAYQPPLGADTPHARDDVAAI